MSNGRCYTLVVSLSNPHIVTLVVTTGITWMSSSVYVVPVVVMTTLLAAQVRRLGGPRMDAIQVMQAAFDRLCRLFNVAHARGDLVALANVTAQIANFNPFLVEARVPLKVVGVSYFNHSGFIEGYRPDHIDDDRDVIELPTSTKTDFVLVGEPFYPDINIATCPVGGCYGILGRVCPTHDAEYL